MTDRRRINGPPSGTYALVFAPSLQDTPSKAAPVTRTRNAKQHRKIFLRTALTPSASGSAYLELQSTSPASTTIVSTTASLKLSCTVHGPKPLPRSAPFSPQLLLSTHIQFTPYASRSGRRGFVRDTVERDLGVHLETALRGVIIGDRWPKSGVDVTITVLEAEEDALADLNTRSKGVSGTGMMNVLAGCITVASAAMIEAGIDCVDTATGGVAALVRPSTEVRENTTEVVIDPGPSEHQEILAACVVGYLPSRDEITEMWIRGDVGSHAEELIDRAVEAATSVNSVLAAVLKENIAIRQSRTPIKDQADVAHDQSIASKIKAKTPVDVEMTI